MKIHRLFASMACSVVLSLGLTTTSSAAPITWNLQNFVFNDGGSASGSYVFDAATGTYSGISISTTAGSIRSGGSYGFVTTLENASRLDLLDTGYPVIDNVTQRMILDLVSAMTDAGGTIGLKLEPAGFAREHVCASAACDTNPGIRLLVSGFVTTDRMSVPEPASLALVTGALAGLVLSRRRKPVTA